MTPQSDGRIARALRAAAPPVVAALGAGVLLRFPPALSRFYPRCPVYEIFHLQCPGCGATRALAALLHGRFAEGLHLNALFTLLLPFAVAYAALLYYRLLRREPMRWPVPSQASVYAMLALAAVFTILRNLPIQLL